MPFDKSRFIMTFLTILELTEILCSLRLVLERKTDKDIPESSRLEFLEKFLAKYFALSDAEDKASGPLNREGTVDLPLLTTLLAICQVPRARFLGNDGLFCFVSMCKLHSFKNPFAANTIQFELYFRIRRSLKWSRRPSQSTRKESLALL